MHEVEHEHDAEVVEDPTERDDRGVEFGRVIPARGATGDHPEHQESVAQSRRSDEAQSEGPFRRAIRAAREGDQSNADHNSKDREEGGRNEVERGYDHGDKAPETGS